MMRVAGAALVAALSVGVLDSRGAHQGRPYVVSQGQAWRLDHVNVVVRDLAAARRDFERLGFTFKHGRPHENSILNEHMKFPDSTELELITATQPRDDLSRRYLQLLEAGEGGAHIAMRPDGGAQIAESIPEVFTIPYLLSPTDSAHHFRHPNGAYRLRRVGRARCQRPRLRPLRAPVHQRRRGAAGQGRRPCRPVRGRQRTVRPAAPGQRSGCDAHRRGDDRGAEHRLGHGGDSIAHPHPARDASVLAWEKCVDSTASRAWDLARAARAAGAPLELRQQAYRLDRQSAPLASGLLSSIRKAAKTELIGLTPASKSLQSCVEHPSSAVFRVRILSRILDQVASMTACIRLGKSWLAFCFASSCFWMLPAALQSQDTLIVTDPPSCASCQVVANRLAILNGGAPLPGTPLGAAVDAHGHVVLSVGGPIRNPMIFDSAGILIGHLEPAAGDSFEIPPALFACQEGGLCAHDARASRLYVFEGHLASGWSRMRAPFAREIVELPRGGFVLAADYPRPSSVGLPLHRFDAEGVLRASFGARDSLYFVGQRRDLSRRVTLGRDSTIWSVNTADFTLEQWSPEGRPVRVLKRDPSWFAHGVALRPRETPPSFVADIATDVNGLLWVTAMRAARQWQSVSWQRLAAPDTVWVPGAIDSLYESVIELIDPRSGSIMGTVSVDASLIFFATAGLAIQTWTCQPGRYCAALWRVTLFRS